MASGVRTVDKYKLVPYAYPPATAKTSPVGTYVSMKGYNNLTIVIAWVNLAAGATGSAITVKQAKWVNGNGAKAVALDYQWASNDTANSVALTQTAIASNTFTTDNTASGVGFAILEVRADRLDMANGFTALAVGIGNTTNSTMSATYVMGNVPRFSGGTNSFMDPLVD